MSAVFPPGLCRTNIGSVRKCCFFGTLFLGLALFYESQKRCESLSKNIKFSEAITDSFARIHNENCKTCGSNSACFMGQCFCLPQWTGNDCQQPLEHDLYRHCARLLHLGGNSSSCQYSKAMCLLACHWHPVSGVTQIPLETWKAAQSNEQDTWRGSSATTDRGDEHFAGFGEYSTLPISLGDVLEFGPGPWSQLNFLLGKLQYSVTSVTLVEPGLNEYMRTVPTCAYKSGQLRGLPTTLVNSPAEDYNVQEKFDTVICMNTVEHVRNAYAFLSNIWSALKPGGNLIWHERWYHDLLEANCILGDGFLHPIRLSRTVLDTFLSGFDIAYLNLEPTAEMIQRKCNERGYYVIARKRKLRSMCCNTTSSLAKH